MTMQPSKSSPLSHLALLLAGLAVSVITACGFFGAAGSLLVSEQDEARLGAQFHQALRDSADGKKEFPIFVANTPARSECQAYVTGVFNSVLAAAKDRPGYNFTFTLIDKDVENAFAVPGGYVYIYTGIINKMQNEAELAGVLGHEVAHVTQHHYREQLAKNTALAVILSALLGDSPGALAQLGAQTLFGLTQLKFSRGDENEADAVGARYVADTQRNPMGIATYFSRAESRGPEFLSSHPSSDTRVNNIEKMVNRKPELSTYNKPEYNNEATFRTKTQGCRG